jgi:cysteine-rich repeat protein
MDLSLSSDSNAHVGGKDVYPYKIYCGHRSGYCGDGRVDAGEECDDGNTVDNDRCSNDCKLEDIREAYWTNEAGNGVIIQATKIVGQEADVYMFLSSLPGQSMQGKTITYEIYQRRVGGGNQPIRVGSNAISEIATSSSGLNA